MDLSWEYNHRLNIFLLSAIGLWPHGNSFFLGLQRFIGSYHAFVCVFSSLATFFTLDYTKKLLLNNAPCMFISCAMFAKYVSYLAVGDSIRKVTENINNDWKSLSNKEEIRIIEKYVEKGKFQTRGFAMFLCPAMICLSLAPWYPVVLDIAMPLSEQRNRSFPIVFEMFIDQQKYFFELAFLFDSAMIFAGIIFTSTETLLLVYLQHACALFEVTSYRVKKVFSSTAAKDLRTSRSRVVIAHVIETHSMAIRHCKLLKENFYPPYIILLAIGILSLSTHLYCCTEAFDDHQLAEFLMSSLLALGILGYMLYLHFASQCILDSSLSVFDDLYACQWYEFPASSQKLVLFCMINTIKPVPTDICGIYHPSYESFAMVLKMVVSYVTALLSFK